MIIACAVFMEQLDATILATALPTMARSFQVSVSQLSLALTAYLLSLAVFIPASGAIADRWGARRVFSGAILIFMVGSVLCATATNFEVLIGARLLQGAGGALMVPVGRLVLLRSIEKRDLVAAMGWLLTPGLAGQILGPPLGGAIVSYLDWHWIFYINLPIGMSGLVLTHIFIPDVKGSASGRFDTPGFLLSGISLACLLFGFETLSRTTPGSLQISITLIAIGALSAYGYFVYAKRLTNRSPILDMSLMRLRTFRVSVYAGSLTRITQGAQPFLLPLMMQIGFGLSAIESGLLTVSAACGFVLMKPAASPILEHVPMRTVLVWNSVLSSLLFASCALFRPDWPHWVIFLVLFLSGFSISLQLTAYNTVCFDEVPLERTAAANSFYSTAQQLMLSAGICTAAVVLTGSRFLSGHAVLTLPDFSIAFLVVTAISLLATPVNASLPLDAGQMLRNRRSRALSN